MLHNAASPNVYCSLKLTETDGKCSLQEGRNAHNISVDKPDEATVWKTGVFVLEVVLNGSKTHRNCAVVCVDI
jgi:hypothetical protein